MNCTYLLLMTFSASFCASPTEEKTSLKSLSAVENDLQNILDRLEALAIGRNEETKEIADKINTLAANIQRLTEKRDATSSPNATERDAESQPSTSGIDASSNPNASERDAVSSPGTSERDAAGISESNPCGCDVTLAAARSEDEVWRPDETPAEDCLDRHMANKTGCRYTPLRVRTSASTARAAPAYDGALYAWRGAVRAPAAAVVRALWGWGRHYTEGYTIYIGRDGNDRTTLNRWSPWQELQSRPTPGILAADRYVHFYVKIQAPGILTFGRECDREPLFTQQVDISRGQQVRVQLQPYAARGGKFLDCSATPQDES